MAAANEALDAADEDLRARVTERRNENRTPQELEDELARIETDLSCMSAVSPLVLEAYNKRKVDVRRLHSLSLSLSQLSLMLCPTFRSPSSRRSSKLRKSAWTTRRLSSRRPRSAGARASSASCRTSRPSSPPHSTVRRVLCVTRGSQGHPLTAPLHFAALGLLGEVRLATDDDYEKWGIEIMVSFRDRKDNSQDVVLHVLSGQRQSGGVRFSPSSLLLAAERLTEGTTGTHAGARPDDRDIPARARRARTRAVCPRRRDQPGHGPARRAQHAQDVRRDDVQPRRRAVRPSLDGVCVSAQQTDQPRRRPTRYFLLTPKLLPDLVYHPKMKVLVINVSPYVPSDMSLQGIIDNKRALVRKRKRADAAGGARTAVLAQ